MLDRANMSAVIALSMEGIATAKLVVESRVATTTE